jgi:hypothetical protein
VIGTLITVAFLIFAILFSERLDLIASNPNSIIRHFAPTWRSLKKMLDVPYFIGPALSSSELPVFNLTLTAADRTNLLDNLPNYPNEDRLTESFKRASVKGEFRYEDYATSDARVRYRGISPRHWNAVKKSWHVNLPDENPLNGRTDFRFFLPEDKGWVISDLLEERGKSLGLITPEVSYSRLSVNSIDFGIYLLIEGWEESLLERHGKPVGPIFSNKNLSDTNPDLFRAQSLALWENRFQDNADGIPFEALHYFLDLVENAPDDMFEKLLPEILDMPSFYKWTFGVVLSNSFQQVTNSANQNLYFNPETGKFEPIFFDVAFLPFEGAIDISRNRLVNRVMSINTFRNDFYTIARPLFADNSFIEKDLRFYDKTYDSIKSDIASDTKKLQPTALVFAQIKKERDMLENNFKELAKIFNSDGELPFVFAEESYPLTPGASFGTNPLYRP